MDWDPEYLAAIEKEQCRLFAEGVRAALAAPVVPRPSDIDMLRARIEQIQQQERPIVDVERRDRAAAARWHQMAEDLDCAPQLATRAGPPPNQSRRGNDAYRAITEGRVTTYAALKQRLLRDPEVA